MTVNFQEFLQRYERELFASVVPFWEKNCLDRRHGGYFTFLDRDGTVYSREKFMWMQWRIVYMFATLYATPYREDRWLEFARHGYDFLVRHGRDEEGSYYFVLNEDGTPAAPSFNIYSDAFACMGCAALYRATGHDAYRREAASAFSRYRARMDDPEGRWQRSLPGAAARRTLGIDMIFANLGEIMAEALGTDAYDAEIEAVATRIFARFWHPEHRVLLENVPAGGGFDLASVDGRLVTPGHGLETMWFLLQHAERTGDAARIRQVADAILGTLDFGWDQEAGGVYYLMDVLGQPLTEPKAALKAWWPQAEAILAALYAYRLTHEPVFLQWFQRLDAWTFQHYPDPEFGEWYAFVDCRGEPTHRFKGGQWKTFFHVPRCLLFAIEHIKKLMDGHAGK